MGALVAACTGVIGGSDPPVETSRSPLCTKPMPGPAPLRRLTQAQYDNVVRDLLGDTSQPGRTFPADATVGEFSNNATTLVVSPLLAQAYEAAAESLSGVAITDDATLLPCSPQKDGEDACARAFIASFGKRAYRRPLAQSEINTIFVLYAANRDSADFNNGIRAVIELMLQAAPFLYQVEAGDAAKATDGVAPLTSWEMASRLSFFLWGSMPDDALFAAAQADQLQTPEQVEAQARRMLGSPKAHDATADFFSQWLHLDGLYGATKDPTLYPQYTDAMRASMQKETLAFTDWVLWQSDGRVSTLLTAPVSFLDANTSTLYGLNVTSTTPMKTPLDPKQRAGILTQPSVMAVFAKPNQSSPVTRGKWVRERLLCQRVPPPPSNVNIIPPEVKSGQSTRQRFAQHDADPACAGCHKLMDPIGFGFEHYDAIGRYRTMDQGLPVDATGAVSTSDVDGAFDGVPALASMLAGSKQVTDCVSVEWFRYAFGRGETPDDECSLGSVKDAFAKGNYDMKELLIAMTRTAAFRYRPISVGGGKP